jgi:hypothetical protein
LDQGYELLEFLDPGRDRVLREHSALWVDRCSDVNSAVRVDADGGDNLHVLPSVMHR